MVTGCSTQAVCYLWLSNVAGPGGHGTGASVGVELRRTPAVPSHDTSVRMVWLAEQIELLRRRRRDPPGEAEAFANAQVACGPDIEPSQLEHQEHFGGPRADATHLGETRDHLF